MLDINYTHKSTLTVSPSQARVTSHKASLCSRLASTSVRLFGWLFQRKQNCWSIVGANVSDRAANNYHITMLWLYYITDTYTQLPNSQNKNYKVISMEGLKFKFANSCCKRT